ncbi:MAG: hypothetical protein C0601_11555 [Candidatus Muiribacterium halophilum]|uniref:Type II secretion system protein GspG C-terminal domain-containing protein n=1 Tax=Muiribacterium halophilum TaxID=2053465 RepID=A0A2N5ZBF7_MUIH1|nr:MAG: hypothetical protein C0601_11555 [Candidatus Muirbacterium halophilum]
MYLKNKAFSLVELMIVVAIIGILVAALLPQLSEMIEKAKLSTAQKTMKTISDAILQYNTTESQELESLEWLVPNYIKEVKKDPWGSPFLLLPDSGIIISYGPDRKYSDQLFSPAGKLVNRDNIMLFYKPKLRIKAVEFKLDLNANNKLNNGDQFEIFFTKPAGGNGTGATTDTEATPISVNVNGDDFDFINCYDPSNPPAEGIIELSAFNTTGMTVDPTYLKPIVATSPVSAVSLTLIDKTTGLPGVQSLNGEQADKSVLFQVITTENTEIDHDIYVRFDSASTDISTGTYWDKRGLKAVPNGYALKIEPKF